MSILKDKLENYSAQPDEKVWTSIEKTMHAKAVARRRRRVALAASAVAVAAAAVAAVAISNRQPDNDAALALTTGQYAPAPAPQTTVNADAVATTPTASLPDAMTVTAATSPVQTQTPVTPLADNHPQTASSPMPATETSTTPPIQPAQQTAATMPQLACNNTAAPTASTKTATQHTATANSDETPMAAAAPQQPSTTAPDNNSAATKQQRKISPAVDKAANEELVVWIPNAFAPDDPNDEVRTFKVKPNSEANLLSYEIFIYSRSGRQVYHSKDVNDAWDGTANGHQQPMGTYVYIIEINDAVKGIQHKKGTITLIR